MTQSINLQLPHSLSQSVAFDRLLDYLHSKSGGGFSFAMTRKQVNINFTTHTVQIVADALGQPIDALFDVGVHSLEVTDRAPGRVKGWLEWLASGQLQRELAEVLKP